MFVLLSRFTQSKASILACLFIAFCSPQMISATLYIRQYELQVCMAIVCAILFCDSFDAIFTSLRFESKRNLFLGALIIALFLLTGYFSLILMAFLGLALLFLCFVKQRYNSAGFLLWLFALSVVFALALYFRYGSALLFDRVTRSASKLLPSTIFTNPFQTFLYAIIIFTRENVFLILLFALCLILFVFHAVCFFKDKAKSRSFVCKLTLICCATLFYLATLHFAPWKILRYITAAFPFFSLLFAFDVKKKATVVAQILACVCLTASVLPVWKYEMKTLPQESTPVALIEHVDDARISEIELLKDESIPVVFFGEGRYVMVIPYLQDTQKVFFIDDMADLDSIKAEYGKIWFCMNADECELFEETKYNVISYNDVGYHQREFLLD